MFTSTSSYLGPATVTGVRLDKVFLSIPDREVEARLALAFPYKPVTGDVVLAIAGEEGEVYIIGVLSGRGATTFAVEGDLQLKATGTVRISGERGIDLKAPLVTVKADKVETVARTIFERSVACYRWIKESLQTQAGRTRTLVEGNAVLHAGRIVETAEKEVKIDGKEVLLG